MIKYVAPEYNKTAFNCPYCDAYANQNWSEARFQNTVDENFVRAYCRHCHSKSYWYKERMVVPDSSRFGPPNPDLGEDIIFDYNEAASIAQKSPRGAAALLRLAIQKLCIQLGEKGKNINNDIGELVKKGLSPKVQKMLDIVRVIGNNAVHPGQIDLLDNQEIVTTLAKLLNEIASEMISKPRELDEMYNSLPKSVLDGINKRDGKVD